MREEWNVRERERQEKDNETDRIMTVTKRHTIEYTRAYTHTHTEYRHRLQNETKPVVAKTKRTTDD